MKKTILSLAAFAIVIFAQAQQQNNQNKKPVEQSPTSGSKQKKPISAEQKADKFLSKMDQTVKLDEKQKLKVRSLALDHFVNVESVRKQFNGDKEKMKPEIARSRKIMQEGLKKVLSPEQLELWKSNKKSSPKGQKANPGNEQNDPIED